MTDRPYAAGTSLRRLEDDRLLTGQAIYTDDLKFPGALHAVVLRSPHAHARIGAIETEAARALAGVALVITADDLRAANVASLPFSSTVPSPLGGEVVAPKMPILAHEVVRYVGEPVACVVAADVATAQAACEAIEVDYDPLPHVTDVRDAAASGAPKIWPEAGGNVVARYELGSAAACDEAFRSAAHVSRLSVRNNRVSANPMEPRAAVGIYDTERDTLILLAPKQAPHLCRDMLAVQIFGVPKDRVEVKVPVIGGAFGAKISPYPEDVLVLHAARTLGRPVRWCANRAEGLLSDWPGRDHESDIELAFDAGMGVEISRHARDGAADFAQRVERHSRFAGSVIRRRRFHLAPISFEPIRLVVAVAFGGQQFGFQPGVDFSGHPFGIFGREHAVGHEPFAINLQRRRLGANRPVHERLREGGLVALVVAVAAIAKDVDHDIGVEALAKLDG